MVTLNFHSYANPSGRCLTCAGAFPEASVLVPACCDVAESVPLDQSCPVSDTCDTVMSYYLRDLGFGEIYPLGLRSMAPLPLLDSRGFNFSSSFFGLVNPVVLKRPGPWEVSHCFTVYA